MYIYKNSSGDFKIRSGDPEKGIVEFIAISHIPYKKIVDIDFKSGTILYSEDAPTELETPKGVTLSPGLQALVDRQEFLEDCIAEMASVIYSGEGGEES